MWHAEPHHEATEAVIHIAGGHCGNRGPIWSSAVKPTPNGTVVKNQREGHTAKAPFPRANAEDDLGAEGDGHVGHRKSQFGMKLEWLGSEHHTAERGLGCAGGAA